MTEDEVGPLYCDLMEELKARVQTLQEVVGGISEPTNEQHHRHNVFILEGLYLHLRKCCEILACAMLVAQAVDERFRSSALYKQYRADKLLEKVSRLNPLSFPRPVGPGNWTAGEVQIVAEYPPIFTARELKELYFACDERLHWGRLGEILSGKKRELRRDAIEMWVDKLITGLLNHKIDLPSRGRSMLVQMNDPETGRVCCRFATLAR